MTEEGSEGIGTYVTSMNNTVSQYIATRPILDLCEQFDRRLGAWVSWRWWEHDCLYLEGQRRGQRLNWIERSQYERRMECLRKQRRAGNEGGGTK